MVKVTAVPRRTFSRTVMLVVALSLLPAANAGARRAPSATEARAIAHALHISPATRAVKCFHVRRVFVSTVGPWARANVVRCNLRRADSALSVLQRYGGRWHVRDIGTIGRWMNGRARRGCAATSGWIAPSEAVTMRRCARSTTLRADR